jgi:(p)ppGpp synthase/HD superfamily hydrolase
VTTDEGELILERALSFALVAHGDQRRKGTKIPYVSHLMAVASLVLEDGGAFRDGAAALLHDVVEDTPATVQDLRAPFGDYMARIVEGCSDAVAEPKPPWRERKEAYLATLSSAPPEILRVSVADKLHNARPIPERNIAYPIRCTTALLPLEYTVGRPLWIRRKAPCA